ncbi:LuxR family transcriptional regulator [Qipengyuania citrea]|jgi:LuxR family quorum-sensing system transcriptional regulator CciR|uniref:LuxR family transcriptional regulator n=1 Tax=Qipengyuania citrea TaxID=225971 RepID=UPI00209F1BAD|nr:LuxR family transcriptional regulator [Qipengyuania citrea]MCP2018352.1 DNA-binding CsgD family transcriptional regulator [Qipengyuania citrea]
MQAYFAEEFASELVNVQSDGELDQALKQVSRRLGFDHFALSLELRSGSRDAPGLLLHDYPDEWAKVYVGFDLAGQDPVRRACDKSFVGFAWGSLGELIPLTRGDRQMLAVGRECGIGDGYTVPRHLPGLARGTCTFAVCPDRDLPHSRFSVAEMVGTLALSCALGLGSAQSDESVPVLSDRQRECLLWIARGKTSAETAMILGIATETVIQHLKMARERYQVHCKQSLIVSALFDGLIGFSDIIRWRDAG